MTSSPDSCGMHISNLHVMPGGSLTLKRSRSALYDKMTQRVHYSDEPARLVHIYPD